MYEKKMWLCKFGNILWCNFMVFSDIFFHLLNISCVIFHEIKCKFVEII